MNDITKQQIRKYKIDRGRLIKGSKHSMYVHEDILIPINRTIGSNTTIKSILCRKNKAAAQNLRK